ncbi:hypothetical protein MWU58_09585 [Flavobacteriaceae bacterium S0825]|uniref:hypothetical protein n=1 Tax=Gaetbulibacter sp. S0825 TaxID=2720084 RepID=UPI0014315526|nr:hypothetical protein [Gaetbulibacter sp. S0825]MCK0109545.1 hypothetical protein [Flavobacteriaceae bacterium S0825]NIX65178.1 hypothetical protein [Gaetbulibacter sp. S0825]
MNKQLNKTREEYEYSPLFIFIQEDWFQENELYKKIDIEIFLDCDLTINDLAIYLAIVRYSSFEDFYQNIPNQLITGLTGITQTNQSRSVKKLADKGYIEYIHSDYSNRYKVEVNPKKYLKVKLEQFNGLKYKTEYVRRLKGLILSNCGNCITTYKTSNKRCNNKLTRAEYKKIKKIYNDNENTDYENSVSNYIKLAI